MLGAYKEINLYIIEEVEIEGNRRIEGPGFSVEALVDGKWKDPCGYANPREAGIHVARNISLGDLSGRGENLPVTYEPPRRENTAWKSFCSSVDFNGVKPHVFHCRTPSDAERKEFFSGLMEEMQRIRYQIERAKAKEAEPARA